MKELQYKRIPKWVAYIINTICVAAIIFVLSYLSTSKIISSYYSSVLMLVGVNIILAVALNIATGYLGQLPLGHAGFMAIGAYSCAIIMKSTSLPTTIAFPIALLVGGLLAGVVGILIGIPALRLQGDYLAILTLGFSEIIRVIILNIDDVLGFKLTYGAASLKSIPKVSTVFNIFLVVAISLFFIHTFMKSRHGRAVLSIRENEIAAESCGIKTTYYKVLAFTVSAFFTGIAGGLYACYIGVLNPSAFSFNKSIEVLVMVVLGGMGSMLGSVISATVLTIVPQLLQAFENYRMVIYSLLLIVVMIFKPSGLMGTFDFSFRKFLEKNVLNVKYLKEQKKKEQESEAKE